jgi:hypothetical protein
MRIPLFWEAFPFLLAIPFMDVVVGVIAMFCMDSGLMTPSLLNAAVMELIRCIGIFS